MVVDFSSLKAISYCLYKVFYYFCEKFVSYFLEKIWSKNFFSQKKVFIDNILSIGNDYKYIMQIILRIPIIYLSSNFIFSYVLDTRISTSP